MMRFLPIVGRELLEAARRRGTYWIRVGAAGVGLLVGTWILIIPGMQTPQTLGISMFVALAIVTYLYCLFIGVFRTADCLSEEKREGTLGLLFLTDLKGYDIVVGKLVASSLNAFYGVLALFPVMAIPLLVGGVTVNEFWRVVLVALDTMFFSMAAGMFTSAVSRDERRAMTLAFLAVVFFAGGIPLLAMILQDNGLGPAYAQVLMIPSPGYAAWMSFEAVFKSGKGPNYFTLSVAIIHALSWVLLVAASRIVPRTWQDRPLGAAGPFRRRLQELEQGSPEQRRDVRRRLLAINPFYWLVARERMKLFAVWGILGAGGLLWILGLWQAPHVWKDEGAFVWTSVLAHLMLKFWVGTEASRRFSLDRQNGALELLVSTPLPVSEIVRGQMMGLERQFGGPMLVVLAADFVFMMSGLRTADTVVPWVAWMVVLVADLLALSWAGMWRGLNSRRPNRAAVAVLARVLVLPWVLFGLLMTVVMVGDAASRGSFGWDGNVFVLIWAIISLVVDVAFGAQAHRCLLHEFRLVLAQRFGTRNPGGG